MPIAYSYIRFSSAKQELGDSLRRQVALSETYAKRHGLVLDTTLKLRDLGVSAFDRSNVRSGALKGFLDAVHAGEVPPNSLLLVESLDRLSRAEVMDALEVFTSIINAGITIVTLTDDQRYSRDSISQNWAQLIVSISVMSRAHEESLIKSKRLGASWAAKRQRAAVEKLTRRCPAWMTTNADRTAFALRPDAVRVVRRIIKLSVDGLGQASIAKQLNEERVPNISGHGKGWQSSYINKILTSTALFGEARFDVHRQGKRIPIGEPIPNYYPALITEAEWRSLQAIRADRHTGGGGGHRNGAVSNLFSGLLQCGYCRGTMTIGGYSKKDPIKSKRYIVCSTAKRGLGCSFVQWGMGEFERLVLSYLEELDIHALLNEGPKEPDREAEAERSHLQAELAKTKTQLSLITQAIEAGGNLKTLVTRLTELERETTALEAQLEALERELRAQYGTEENAEFHRRALIDIEALAAKPGDARRNAIRLRLAANIRQLIEGIYVYPGGLQVATTYDDADQPVSHQLLRVSKDDRLALIWFRAGNQVRQVLDGAGQSSAFDLTPPPKLVEHARAQRGRWRAS